MGKSDRTVSYGIRDVRHNDLGCAADGFEYVMLGLAVFAVFSFGGRVAGIWALAVGIVLCLVIRLFASPRVRVDPEGLTIARPFRKRVVPWTAIKRAEYPGPTDWGSAIIWVGDERVSLPAWIDERWDVKGILWKYLRHYAECPPPKRASKKKRSSAGNDVDTDTIE